MKVLLIHGLSRTPLSLRSLEKRLQQAGWTTEHFAYVAYFESYDQICDRLQKRLNEISNEEPYYIVAHSLGGLLARSALGNAKFKLPTHVVMLGTPNLQPRMATYVNQVSVIQSMFQWWTRECGANLGDAAFFAQLPMLKSPYTIIAGTGGPRGAWSPFGDDINDGIVALSEVFHSQDDRVISFPVFHSFMMSDRAVQDAVLDALRSGQH